MIDVEKQVAYWRGGALEDWQAAEDLRAAILMCCPLRRQCSRLARNWSRLGRCWNG